MALRAKAVPRLFAWEGLFHPLSSALCSAMKHLAELQLIPRLQAGVLFRMGIWKLFLVFAPR
jgi:hypothetical protein